MRTFWRKALIVLCLVLFAAPFTPRSFNLSAYATENAPEMKNAVEAESVENKAVRVGWYESPFNLTDQFGRRSGYAYEYQQKIAVYTGWNYEYVTGSWPELYQMFLDGQLDLMSDVSFTQERAEQMLFADLPMGSEAYYICISAQRDSDITADDVSTLHGKKIGVNKDSF